MNITAELIVSILAQAKDITCKNIRTESECAEDIIVRFEDDTDTTISVYYTPVIDLVAIGTINGAGAYRNNTRYQHVSRLDPDTFRKYITFEVGSLELEHKIQNEW